MLLFSVKNDYIGLPNVLIQKDKEDSDRPLLQSKLMVGAFSVSAVMRFEAIKCLKLIIQNYDAKFLTRLSWEKDHKNLTSHDYAEKSKNEDLKELFYSVIGSERPGDGGDESQSEPKRLAVSDEEEKKEELKPVKLKVSAKASSNLADLDQKESDGGSPLKKPLVK